MPRRNCSRSLRLVDVDLTLAEVILLDIVDILLQLLRLELGQVVALLRRKVVGRNLHRCEFLSLNGGLGVLKRNRFLAEVIKVELRDLLSSLRCVIVVARQDRWHPVDLLRRSLSVLIGELEQIFVLRNLHAENLKDLVLLVVVFGQEIVILLATLAVDANLPPEVQIQSADALFVAHQARPAGS